MKQYMIIVAILICSSLIQFYIVSNLADVPTPAELTLPEFISTDTIYKDIDSLKYQRDTLKIYYETKTYNYNTLPSNDRVVLFAERINR
jgi:hypothetical protein